MSTYISVQLRRQVRDAFKNRCAYCLSAEELTVTTFEIDHIIPVQAGGTTKAENLCLTCPMGNRHKATRQHGRDPDTGQVVALFHPQKHVWSEHFVRTVDGERIIGLTPEGRATITLLQMNRNNWCGCVAYGSN